MRTQFFHPIFTQPGKVLLVQLCTLLPYDVVDGLQVVDEVRVVGGAVVALVAADELAPSHVVVHDGALRGGEPAVVALLVVVRTLDVLLQLREEAGVKGALGAPEPLDVVRVQEVLVQGLLVGGLVVTAEATLVGGAFQQLLLRCNLIVILIVQNVDHLRDWGDLCCGVLRRASTSTSFAHLDICTWFARLGITLGALELAQEVCGFVQEQFRGIV